MLMESVIAAVIAAAALVALLSDLGVDSVRRLQACWYECL